MRETISLFLGGPGETDLARFAGLTYVGKSAGHQLPSPAEMPTKVSLLA